MTPLQLYFQHLIYCLLSVIYTYIVHCTLCSQGNDGPGILTSFSTPARSFAKTIIQTAGDLDYGTLFEEANLLYSPMAYILFLLFVVLIRILFTNLLVRYSVFEITYYRGK